jgi:hypothetical protein
MVLHEKLYREFQEKMKDPRKAEAWRLREEAWDIVHSKKNYDPGKAVDLIVKAAERDEEYVPQIQLVKDMIERKSRKGKVNLKKAVNSIFVPAIKKMDFQLYAVDITFSEPFRETGEWTNDVWFIRHVKDARIMIDMGRTKFGNALGVMISKIIGKDRVVYLEHDTDLNYLNQRELEEVLKRLLDTIKSRLDEWIEIT